jgi:isocitrate dehydrogenase
LICRSPCAPRLQGNINYKTGHAIFEATHGTAPK